MEYRKKPEVIDEAITFSEFVEYGLKNSDNIVNGVPWSFEYKGYAITHENDECYIIPTLEGNYNFTPSDMLVTDVKGEIYPCKTDVFNMTYEIENQLFKKHEIIKQEDAYFQCIVCDYEYATFGKIKYNKEDEVLNTSFGNIFIVSNLKNVSEGVFEFKRATGKDVKEKYI